MTREAILLIALQSGALLLTIWGIFRLFPTIPANSKAWIWRLAFLKPLLSLVPFAVITLHVLPSHPPLLESSGTVISVPESVAAESSSGAAYSGEASTASASQMDPMLVLWVLGACVIAGYGVWGLVKAVLIVRSASSITQPQLQEVLMELMDRARVAPPVHLLASSSVQSAMLVGGFRPTIVLPQSAIDEGSMADLRLMLAHEIAHIARRDLTWFGVTSVVQTLFFFNPVVWLAAKCSRLDHESATDRYAAQLAGVPIHTYADMLLRATVAARIGLAPGTLRMAASYRTIHRRLEAMKHFNSKLTAWPKSAIAVLALVTCGLLPNYQLAQAQSGKKPVNKVDAKKPAAKAVEPASSKTDPGNYKVWMQTKGKKTAWVTNDKNEKVSIFAWNGKKYVKLKDITRAQFEKEKAALLKESKKVGQSGGGTQKPGTVAPKAEKSSGLGSGTVSGQNGSTSSSRGVSGNNATSGQEQNSSLLGTSASGKPSGQISALEGRPSSDPISITFDDQDVRIGLDALLRQVARAYVISPDVQGRVTLDLKDVSIETALNDIVRQFNGSWSVENGVYTISAKPAASRKARPGITASATISDLDLKGTDVQEALRAIAREAGWTYNIDPMLQGTVHLRLREVTFEQAIQKILDQVNGTYIVEAGVFKFKPRA